MNLLKRLALALVLCAVPCFAQNPQQGNSLGTLSTTTGSCGTSLVNTTSCVVLPLQKDAAAATISISGSFTGTLNFEITNHGTTGSLLMTPQGGGTAVTSTTAPGTWQVGVAATSAIQVRASALSSGTPAIVILASKAPAAIQGQAGATGAQGPAGSPANYQGAWSSVTTYTIGQSVTYTDGYFYVSLINSNLNNIPPNVSADWQKLESLSTDNTWTNQNRFSGPIPWIDLSTRARVSVNSSTGPATTCSSTATSTAITLAAGSQFQNGDGINCRGAGPTIAMTTPTAPTVTPSNAAAGTGLQYSDATVAGTTGSSTYSYEVIAADKFGGYTAVSPATTIATGQASIGHQTCAISTITRSGINMMITFTAPCLASVIGTQIRVEGPSSATYDGFYNVTTVNSSSQVVVASMIDCNAPQWQSQSGTFTNDQGACNQATGGLVEFWLSNHISWTAVTGAWKYYLCAERPGDVSYKLIGQTIPSTSVQTVNNYDDYGSPYNDSQPYPPYITNSLCNGGAAQNDPLNTTIVSGGGTNNIVVANAATNTVSGTTATFDDCPGLQAAVNAAYAGGNFQSATVLIPSTVSFNNYWVINSYCKLAGNVSIWSVGDLVLNEPVELQAGTKWLGYGAADGNPQFNYYSAAGAPLQINSVPGIYVSGDSFYMSDMIVSSTNNQNGEIFFVVDGGHATFNHTMVVVSTGTDSDFLGMAYVDRGMVSSADGTFIIKDSSLLTGGFSTKDSWTPILYETPASTGQVTITGLALNQRGFEFHDAGNEYELGWITRQAGVMPMFWWTSQATWNASVVRMKHIILDTDLGPVMAVGNAAGFPVYATFQVWAEDINMGSQDTGGFVPAFQGIGYKWTDFRSITAGKNPNATSGFSSCPYGGNGSILITCTYGPFAMAGASSSVYFPLAAPTNVVATLQSGGSLTPGAYQFAMISTGYDGKDTIPSVISNSVTVPATCPGSGTCSVSLAWTNVSGAVSYKLAGCGPLITITCPTIVPTTTTGVTSNPLTINSFANSGLSFVPYTQSGVSGQTANASWGLTQASVPRIFSTLAACSATLNGTTATVTDSTVNTWGTTITGGGANTVLAFCDGTTWTVYGK